MASLKQLIEEGQYELAAHRLVYGIVRASMDETVIRTNSARGSRQFSGRANASRRRETPSRG